MKGSEGTFPKLPDILLLEPDQALALRPGNFFPRMLESHDFQKMKGEVRLGFPLSLFFSAPLRTACPESFQLKGERDLQSAFHGKFQKTGEYQATD